jgi:hypothetical protein
MTADTNVENWNHGRATPHHHQALDLDFVENIMIEATTVGKMDAKETLRGRINDVCGA